jgi:hypothetical protein
MDVVREVDPWRARQRKYFEDFPKRCVICGATDAIHAHHRHYRDDRGMERDRTIVALCAFHHRQVHRWHDKFAPRDVSPYRWLSIVTTFAIVALSFRCVVRQPWMVVAATVIVTVLIGVWVPIVALVLMLTAGPLRRVLKKPT